MTQVYFSLGSNAGDRRATLQRAIALMQEEFTSLDGSPRHPVAVSSFIETPPWGFDADTSFINCAVRFDLDASCRDILASCQKIERQLGRPAHDPLFDPAGNRIYTSRSIDIDIIFYGVESISEPGLIVPHPLWRQRPFVIEPLSEIISPFIRTHFCL